MKRYLNMHRGLRSRAGAVRTRRRMYESTETEEALKIALDTARRMHEDVLALVQKSPWNSFDIEVGEPDGDPEPSLEGNIEAWVTVTPYSMGQDFQKDFKKLSNALEVIAAKYEGGEADVYVNWDQSYNTVPLQHLHLVAAVLADEEY